MIADGIMAIVHLIRDKQPQAHIIVMVRPSYMQMISAPNFSLFESWCCWHKVLSRSWLIRRQLLIFFICSRSRCFLAAIWWIRCASETPRSTSCWPTSWCRWLASSWSIRLQILSSRTGPSPTWICTTISTWRPTATDAFSSRCWLYWSNCWPSRTRRTKPITPNHLTKGSDSPSFSSSRPPLYCNRRERESTPPPSTSYTLWNDIKDRYLVVLPLFSYLKKKKSISFFLRR